MREQITEFLNLRSATGPVTYAVKAETLVEGYRRQLISYPSADGDQIPAYLFMPTSPGLHPAVLVHHQHNGERHFGKSEVSGLAGDPLQAFAPALASRGFVVLAPDSIAFEDRRPHQSGTTPGTGDADFLHHFNELTYRIVKGDTLMRKVLSDASVGLALLENLPGVDKKRLGTIGHSFGGNTALFQAAVDERLSFACASGAVCSYRYKMDHRIPFEFALTIPGFVDRFDFADLLKVCAPRSFLVVSATDDKYSKNAAEVCALARAEYERLNAGAKLQHRSYTGGHALTRERHDFIVNWTYEISRC